MTLMPALRNDTVIARLEAARTALSEAKTIQQSKAIADVAAAAEIYARRQKLGEEAIDFAHAVKIEALRKLGEILKDTDRASGGERGGKSKIDGSRASPSNAPATLAELGVDKKTSSIAQKLADLPDKDFEAVRDGHAAIGAAIAKAGERRPRPDKKASAGDGADTAKLQARIVELEEANENLTDAAAEARVLMEKLEAFENTEPDEQQKEIMRLQLELRRMEADRDYWKRRYYDENHKAVEAIRQVKRQQSVLSKLGRAAA